MFLIFFFTNQYFTLYTRINFKWIKGLNINVKKIKVLEEDREGFSDHDSKSRRKENINRSFYHKIENIKLKPYLHGKWNNKSITTKVKIKTTKKIYLQVISESSRLHIYEDLLEIKKQKTNNHLCMTVCLISMKTSTRSKATCFAWVFKD